MTIELGRGWRGGILPRAMMYDHSRQVVQTTSHSTSSGTVLKWTKMVAMAFVGGRRNLSSRVYHISEQIISHVEIFDGEFYVVI